MIIGSRIAFPALQANLTEGYLYSIRQLQSERIRVCSFQIFLKPFVHPDTAFFCRFLHPVHCRLLPHTFFFRIIKLHGACKLFILFFNQPEYMVLLIDGCRQVTDQVNKPGPVQFGLHQKIQGIRCILNRLFHQIGKLIRHLISRCILIDGIQIIQEETDFSVSVCTAAGLCAFPGQEIVIGPVHIVHDQIHCIMFQHIRHIHLSFQTFHALWIVQILAELVIIPAETGAVDLIGLIFLNIVLLRSDCMCNVIPGVFFLKLYDSVIASVQKENARPGSCTDHTGIFAQSAHHIPFQHGSFMVGTAVAEHQPVIGLPLFIPRHIGFKKIIFEGRMLRVIDRIADQLKTLLGKFSGTVAGYGDPGSLCQHPRSVRLIKFHIGRPVPFSVLPLLPIIGKNACLFVVQHLFIC